MNDIQDIIAWVRAYDALFVSDYADRLEALQKENEQLRHLLFQSAPTTDMNRLASNLLFSMTITNELIAIKVMEWEPISNSPDASFMWRTPLAKARHADYLIELPDFLHDMSAAWLVVEEMRRRGYELHLAEYADKKYCCEFIPKESGLPHTGIEMDSDTAQEAICKAALAVVIM